MKDNNKAQRETREKMIEAYIAEGSKGRIQFDTVRAELIRDLDVKRAAFLSAVADFKASYEEDLQKVIDALERLGSESQGVERLLEAARGTTPSDTEADPSHVDKETEIHVLEAKIEELQDRRSELLSYKPTGNAELLSLAIHAEGVWREAKATADKITAGIRANLRKQIRELRKQEQEAARGVWSSVEIPEDCRLTELKRRGAGSFSVSELIQKRTAAAEAREAIEETVARTRAALKASNAITNEDKDRSSDNEQ